MQSFQRHNILYSCVGEHKLGSGLFLPEHSLWLILSGVMEAATEDGVEVFGKGTLYLSRRNQLLNAVKKPVDGQPFTGISVLLDQASLKHYSLEHGLGASGVYTGEPNVKLALDPFIKGYFDSLLPYFEQPEQLTPTLAQAKTIEAIELVLRHPALRNLLLDFSKPFKIDLEAYMNRHFTYNVSLAQFAKLTGRSLATFKRDFGKVFHLPPEKWLKKRRLEQARILLAQQQRPSEVYLAVGFENLSHFSASFKEHFGYSPSHLNRETGGSQSLTGRVQSIPSG